MKLVGRLTFAVAVVLLVCARPEAGRGAQDFATLFQGPEVEEFLLKGRIVSMASIPVGVAAPRKATVEWNGVQHFAVFKTIDEERPGVSQLTNGIVEANFQDSWRTEIAAYEIDKIIGLALVPATVERTYRNGRGSLQWWIDDSIQEGERAKRKLIPPDAEAWNRTELKVRLFDNLIYNMDRTLQNSLVTPANFRIYLIDHSRSFRIFSGLRNAQYLTGFSRSLLDGLKNLDRPTVSKAAGKYLSTFQIQSLLQRRDAIIALANKLVAEKGEAAVLYP
jgi:hypothetical protein